MQSGIGDPAKIKIDFSSWKQHQSNALSMEANENSLEKTLTARNVMQTVVRKNRSTCSSL